MNADDLLRPWQGFANIWLMADMALVLGVAVLLGAIIAYTPPAAARPPAWTTSSTRRLS